MAVDTFGYIKTRSPFKISLALAVGIILPSGFLGYLGVRSYQYEGQLMEKEIEERYAAVADRVELKVSGLFTDLQTALRTVAGQSSVQHLDNTRLLPLLLSTPKLNSLPTENLFVFDEMDQMAAPWHVDSPASLSSSRRRDLDWGSYTDEIERLERLEFAQKDYAGALHGYTALQSHPLAPSLQAALLKNIAGDYRKLHQNKMAASTYMKLSRQYDSLSDFSGYPMGLLGRQMAIELYEEDKAWENALDTRLDLYEGLLLRQWSVSTAQRNALLQDLRAAIERSLSAHLNAAADRVQRWERIRALGGRLMTLEQSGERFAKNEWPALLQRVRRLGRLDQGAVLQMTPPGSSRMAVVVPVLSPQSDRRRGLLVAVVSASAVWPLINAATVELAQPSGLKVEWETSSVWKPRIHREIHAIDPPLRFTLIDLSVSSRDQLFHRRQWIFGGMIGLSLVMLLMGLLFMGHAVKRETEVANLKADFVANVSHELRTPLTAISHIGERLMQGRYRSEEERKEFYSLLGKETGRLRHLIEDILDFSKMLAGKKVYRQDPLSIVAVVQEALEAFESKAEARGFRVVSELPSEPIRILGDPRALLQVVLNLLDNALKYSGASREIGIKVSQQAQTAVVAVQDHGIGIAESEKDKIFEKFYRVEQGKTGQAEGGVGLGLAMVKHVVEGHGGNIQVDSKAGQGSTFSLVFPLAQEK